MARAPVNTVSLENLQLVRLLFVIYELEVENSTGTTVSPSRFLPRYYPSSMATLTDRRFAWKLTGSAFDKERRGDFARDKVTRSNESTVY